MRRADRLVRIVQFLRAQRRAVTAKRIADEFEICTRTVYRDMADLMASDVPISGEAGVGYMIDARFYLPPIAFSPDELEATGLGIAMVRQWTDGEFAAKAAAAFSKIEAVLPPELHDEIEQITTYAVQTEPELPWTVSFSALRTATRERRMLRFHYRDAGGRESARTIRPLALIFANPVWLLAGWCEMRTDFRNFRLDRIEALAVSEDIFKDEPDKNLQAYKQQDEVC